VRLHGSAWRKLEICKQQGQRQLSTSRVLLPNLPADLHLRRCFAGWIWITDMNGAWMTACLLLPAPEHLSYRWTCKYNLDDELWSFGAALVFCRLRDHEFSYIPVERMNEANYLSWPAWGVWPTIQVNVVLALACWRWLCWNVMRYVWTNF
jgi:hypothetical protein